MMPIGLFKKKKEAGHLLFQILKYIFKRPKYGENDTISGIHKEKNKSIIQS
jgi:hypothetical protein